MLPVTTSSRDGLPCALTTQGGAAQAYHAPVDQALHVVFTLALCPGGVCVRVLFVCLFVRACVRACVTLAVYSL